MSRERTLTAERLRSDLIYNCDTGEFRRKIARGGQPVGSLAGGLGNHGYRVISVGNRLYLSHRLAWLYVHGVWPLQQIDHINGDRLDNRIYNLREATNAQNTENSVVSRGSAGLRGVYLHKPGQWRARIKVNGAYHHLGLFDTPEEASSAYLAAKRELHPFWDAAA